LAGFQLTLIGRIWVIPEDQDEFFDWIADPECGHQQQVRHNPPWTSRHWVTTPEGRMEHVGQELPCSVCSSVASSGTRNGLA
jgi:hypothetical protein